MKSNCALVLRNSSSDQRRNAAKTLGSVRSKNDSRGIDLDSGKTLAGDGLALDGLHRRSRVNSVRLIANRVILR